MSKTMTGGCLCGACGTPLTFDHAAFPGELDVTVVSLDKPDRVAPESHIWIEQKLDWVRTDEHLPMRARD